MRLSPLLLWHKPPLKEEEN